MKGAEVGEVEEAVVMEQSYALCIVTLPEAQGPKTTHAAYGSAGASATKAKGDHQPSVLPPIPFPPLPVTDFGVMDYDEAYARQLEAHERVLAGRAKHESAPSSSTIFPRSPGEILTVVHPPVITVSRRAGAMAHVLASSDELARRGVQLRQTDRGGDVTYHGPGQVVIYPILDLNLLTLRIHAYMRLLEQAVIDTCTGLGLRADRDESATGVWIAERVGSTEPTAKIAAMGVRVKRWITLHGLSFNVEPDLSHFNLIVPCGLTGRPVTSLARLHDSGVLRIDRTPSLETVRDEIVRNLHRNLVTHVSHQGAARPPVHTDKPSNA